MIAHRWVIARTRARFSFLLLAAFLLPIALESVPAAQGPPVAPLTFPPANPSANAEETSLKVRLRLEDESPSLAAAIVSLLPDDDYEIIGTPTETEAETQFSGMLPERYVVEASAPEFLTVRRSMQIEAGHRQRILYVVMTPRPLAQGAEKKHVETTSAATLPAGGNTFVAAAKPAVNGSGISGWRTNWSRTCRPWIPG
jgi:hypothetical protein